MPKAKLSKSVVDKLSALESERLYWDTSVIGFGIRVKPNGTKSYVVQYRNKSTGRSRRKTIGRHGPLLSFSQAKDIATGLLADVLRGQDPVREAQELREAPTMGELADQYLELHAVPKKRAKSIANDRSMLNRMILPRLGNHTVAEIGHKDIQSFHNNHKATPYQATARFRFCQRCSSFQSNGECGATTQRKASPSITKRSATDGFRIQRWTD